jgi:Zn-dependent protease/predicted transcriptional regulator
MKNSLKIGQVRGIRIEVNYSWIIIFVLITLSFATVYFPANFPQWPPYIYWFLGAVMPILLFASVFLHELAHSLVSIKYGIPVPKISLFIFGGMAHIQKEPDTPVKELFIAAAGPLMSFFLFIFFSFLTSIFNLLGLSSIVTVPLFYIANVNLILAIFNLIPALPLDGGRILRAVLWKWKDNFQMATRIAANLGSGFSYILILTGLLFIFNGNLMNGIWFIFIGGFINQSAQQSYQHSNIKTLFEKITIKDLMTPSVISIHQHMYLKEVIEEYFYIYKHSCFPITEGEEVLGIITLDDIKKVSKELWDTTKVTAIMKTLNENLIILYNEKAFDAFQKIMSNEVGRLLVYHNNKMIGIISKTDILKYINIYNELH